MRKALRHSGALLATAIIGLSLIGAAYALWYEDLTLTANVSTGTFNFNLSCYQDPPDPTDCSNGTRPLWSNGEPYPNEYGLNWQGFGGPGLPPLSKAPFCSVSPGTYGTGPSGGGPVSANDDPDYNQLTLTIGNAANGLYPYSGCFFHLDIHNVGSVPGHLHIVSSSGLPPWLNLTILDGECTGIPCSEAEADAWCADLFTATPTDPPTDVLQMHQGAHLVCQLLVWLPQTYTGEDEVTLTTPEGATATWSLLLRAHQWNEGP